MEARVNLFEFVVLASQPLMVHLVFGRYPKGLHASLTMPQVWTILSVQALQSKLLQTDQFSE